MKNRTVVKWALLWHSENKLDGIVEHLIYDHKSGNGLPAVFATRRAARLFAQTEYGYIKTRKDLQAEPHCWMFPKAVKIKIEYSLCLPQS